MPGVRRGSRFTFIQCRSQPYQFRCLHYCLEEVTGWVRQQVLLARLPDATSLSFRLVVRMFQAVSRSQAGEREITIGRNIRYDDMMTQSASVPIAVGVLRHTVCLRVRAL